MDCGRKRVVEVFVGCRSKVSSFLFFVPNFFPSPACKEASKLSVWIQTGPSLFYFYFFPHVLPTIAAVGVVTGAMDSPPSGAIRGGRSWPSLAACGREGMRGIGSPVLDEEKRRRGFFSLFSNN